MGLRTIQLLPPSPATPASASPAVPAAPLRFVVNGRPFFAKGSNWIPPDALYSRITPALLRRYVADAVAVNMNMLRFWGGGYYEDDALFDACDEAGLLVWLDFKFACSSYPAFDPAFMDNVRAEARDNIQRLRHHPSIAVWCGNNEISLMVANDWTATQMGRADYNRLFHTLLADEVHRLDPDANYTPGSPEVGDDHYWGVWHSNEPIESYSSRHGLITEFGLQSFPEPRTVAAYTDPADRISLLSAIMKYHQRNGDGQGNEKILSYIDRYFRTPRDFDSTLWLSQIMQAYGIQFAIEAFRRDWPNSSGAIIWQYNDTWPTASWAAVDYFGRWKALHYATRRFFAPVLVSGTTDTVTGEAPLYVTSDLLQPLAATINWSLTDLAGQRLDQGSLPVALPPQSSQMVLPLNLKPNLDRHGPNTLLLRVRLRSAGQTLSENLLTFAKPRDLDLLDPQLHADITTSGTTAIITLTAARPALYAWIELDGIDARYSDNFLSIHPDTPVRITVQLPTPLTSANLRQSLRVRSLYDTYAHTSPSRAD